MGQVDKKHFAILSGNITVLQDEFKNFGLYYQFVYGDENCSLENGFIVWNTEYTFEQFQKVMLGLSELHKLQSIYIIRKIDGRFGVSLWQKDELEYTVIKQFSKLKFKDILEYFRIIKLGLMQEKACLASTACLMGAYKRHFLMKDLYERLNKG